MSNGLNGTDITSFFGPEDIICQISATERDDVVMAMLKVLKARGKIDDVDAAFETLLVRESQEPTVVAPGIAMPHTRLEGVDTTLISVATTAAGVRFSGGEGGVAKLIILIIVPKAAPGAFLQAAGAFARIFKDPGSASRAVEIKTAAELWRFFHKGAHKLPDYICASDIMTRDVITLREDDTLEHAVDMFARHGLTSLPVVDKDGEVVGIASANDLLRVCLPDHILWMEDLSPIINFEPFVAMLRDEGKTCLSDIMSSEFVTVSEDAPAIQVVQEFRKWPGRDVLVVNAKKLVGIISLQDFINRILRD